MGADGGQTIQAVLPRLVDGAAIVAAGAASAQPAGAGMAPYAAAKAGVARLCEALAKELAPRRIRVNCVLPSIIDTPRNRTDMPEADFAAWTSPAAIADAIHFLASPASRTVNGASLEASNGAKDKTGGLRPSRLTWNWRGCPAVLRSRAARPLPARGAFRFCGGFRIDGADSHRCGEG